MHAGQGGSGGRDILAVNGIGADGLVRLVSWQDLQQAPVTQQPLTPDQRSSLVIQDNGTGSSPCPTAALHGEPSRVTRKVRSAIIVGRDPNRYRLAPF